MNSSLTISCRRSGASSRHRRAVTDIQKVLELKTLIEDLTARWGEADRPRSKPYRKLRSPTSRCKNSAGEIVSMDEDAGTSGHYTVLFDAARSRTSRA